MSHSLNSIAGDKVTVWWADFLPPEAVLCPIPRGHALQRQHPWGDHHGGGVQEEGTLSELCLYQDPNIWIWGIELFNLKAILHQCKEITHSSGTFCSFCMHGCTLSLQQDYQRL